MATKSPSNSKPRAAFASIADPLLQEGDPLIDGLIASATSSEAPPPPPATDALDLIGGSRALAPMVNLSDGTGSVVSRGAPTADSAPVEALSAARPSIDGGAGLSSARSAGADALPLGATPAVEVREAPPETSAVPSSFDLQITSAARLMISGLTLQSLFRPKVADRTDLAVSITATADAVGTDTAADVDIFGRLHDLGAVSYGYAAIKIEATAETGIEAILYAETVADIAVAGADFVFLFRHETSVLLQSDAGTLAHDETTLFALAFDFERWDFRGGPIIVDGTTDDSFFGMVPDLPDLISGNIATFDVDVEARGANTYTDVDVSVVAVEDGLSTVAALVEMGVG